MLTYLSNSLAVKRVVVLARAAAMTLLVAVAASGAAPVAVAAHAALQLQTRPPGASSDGYRVAQQGGTNTRAGSMARGTHVYCPGNSPFRYCKPPAQNAPVDPKPAKNKQHSGAAGITA